MAVRLQIMDERERNILLTKWNIPDIIIVGCRYLEFKDVPYIWYAELTPHKYISQEFKTINRQYYAYLENCRKIYRDPYIFNKINETIQETQKLYDIWDYLYDINNEYYHIHIRRLAIKKLRAELNEIDPTFFKNGIFPPPVPIWRMIQK